MPEWMVNVLLSGAAALGTAAIGFVILVVGCRASRHFHEEDCP